MLRYALILVGVACAQTTRYPGAIDNDSSLYVVADNVQTTLSAAMTTTATAALVASSAGFAPNMIATVCDSNDSTGKCVAWEHMLVTAVGLNNLTVTRAFGGTIARAHSPGRLVSAFIDAVHQKVLKDAIIAIENTLNTTSFSSAPVTKPLPFGPLTSGSGVTTASGNIIAGNNTLTFATVPAGVNGNDVAHYLYVSGPGEACLITGGTGTAGAANGQININCANTHTGSWTIRSATGGIQEALVAALTTGNMVQIPAGTYLLDSRLTVYSKQILSGVGAAAVIKLADGAWPATGTGPFYNPDAGTPIAITTPNGASRIVLQNFTLDMNGANNSNNIFSTDLGPYNCQNCIISGLQILAGHHNGISLGFLGATGSGNQAINNVITGYGGAVSTCTGGLFTQNARTLFSGNYISQTCDESVVFNGPTGSEGISMGDIVVQDNASGAGVTFHAEGTSSTSFIGDICRGKSGICFGASTIPGGGGMTDVHFIDCQVEPDGTNTPVTGFFLRGGTYTIKDVEILGGHVYGAQGWGVLADGVGGTPGNISRLTVHGITVRNSGGGITLSSEVGTGLVSANRLSGNNVGGNIAIVSKSVLISSNVTDDSYNGGISFSTTAGSSVTKLSGAVLDGLFRIGVNVEPNNCADLANAAKAGYCVDIDATNDGMSVTRRSTAGASTRIWQTGPLGTAPETRSFANLGPVPTASLFVYCSNCTTAATCAGGGSGHMAVSNGTNWTCQ
jgi:hypothetical protein